MNSNDNKEIRIPWIDDVPKQVKRSLKRIEAISKEMNFPLKLEILIPNPDFIFLNDLNWDPALVLIDYELFHSEGVKYTGISIAGIIDDYYPDVPRVLVTRKSIVDKNPNITVDVPFDALIFKGDLGIETERYVKLMISLIKNFHQMSEYSGAKRNWTSFLDLLSAGTREFWNIQDCSPPVVQAKGNNLLESRWNPHTVTKWIRNTFFEFPGLLLNSLYASAYLGISEESFLEISEYLNSTRYLGIYSDLGDYWWKSRLREIALDLILEYGMIPDIPQFFSKAFQEDQGAKLRPSICCTSLETHADSVCHVLHRPVKTQYSYIYKPDTRPKGFEQARVSFKAVKESDKFRLESLDDDDKTEAQALMVSSREGE